VPTPEKAVFLIPVLIQNGKSGQRNFMGQKFNIARLAADTLDGQMAMSWGAWALPG
jgi:hypothetical protein